MALSTYILSLAISNGFVMSPDKSPETPAKLNVYIKFN